MLDQHAHHVAQLHGFRHVHYDALQKRGVIVFQETALVDHPAPAVLGSHAVLQRIRPRSALPERGHAFGHAVAVVRVHHEHVLVVEQLLYLFARVAEHVQKAVAHVQEIAPGSVEAAMIAAGHIFIQECKLFVLADQQFVSLGKLLLHRHDFGDVGASAHDGKPAVFRFDHPAFVERPEPRPVLASHAVRGSVLEPHVVLGPDVERNRGQIVRMYGVAHAPIDARSQFLVCVVAQKLHHSSVGEVQRELWLAVSSDHSPRRKLCRKRQGGSPVLFPQRYEQRIARGSVRGSR